MAEKQRAKTIKCNQKDPYYSKKDTLRWHGASFQIIQVFVDNLLWIIKVLSSIWYAYGSTLSILASTDEGDVVLDPFLGSGTTSVVSKKLNRKYVGIELNEEYCCLAEKRLDMADDDPTIQGYFDGVFWERNSLSEQKNDK